MLRNIVAAISAAVALNANIAYGLKLGNVDIKSSLNEPLNAEIELSQLDGYSPNEIFSSLASKKDFLRSGIEMTGLLSNLEFDVVLHNDGRPFISITTDKPIHEPYINFLLEVHWPDGRMLREYTLLIDPNNRFNNQLANTLTDTKINSSAVNKDSKSIINNTVKSNQPGGINKSKRYVVRASDTLWKIARQNVHSKNITIYQSMLAIFQENPNAFVKNDINLIKEGSVLRIPPLNLIQAIEAKKALNQIAQHSVTSKKYKEHLRATNAPISKIKEPESTVDRLTVIGSGDSTSNKLGNVSDKENVRSTTVNLNNKLRESQEQNSLLTRENEELKERLEDVSQQVETLQKIISLKNSELNALKEDFEEDAFSENKIIREEKTDNRQKKSLIEKLYAIQDWLLYAAGSFVTLLVACYLYFRKDRNKTIGLGEENEEVMSDLKPFVNLSDEDSFLMEEEQVELEPVDNDSGDEQLYRPITGEEINLANGKDDEYLKSGAGETATFDSESYYKNVTEQIANKQDATNSNGMVNHDYNSLERDDSETRNKEDYQWNSQSEELSELENVDSIATKINLAQAYIEMGDAVSAQDLLNDVIRVGDNSEKEMANALLDRLYKS